MSAPSRWTAICCGVVLVVAALTGTAAAADETEVTLEPADREVETGEVAEYDVVVTDADDGVGSFDLAATVEDPSVATVENVSYADEPSYAHRPQGETTAQLAATGMDTADDGSVRVATLELEAVGSGTTTISLAASDVVDETGRSYDVAGTEGATLSVPAFDDGDEDDSDENSGDDGDGPSSDGDGDDVTDPSDGDGDEGEGGTEPDDGARAPDDPSDGDDGGSGDPGLAVLVLVAAALVVLVLGAALYRSGR